MLPVRGRVAVLAAAATAALAACRGEIVDRGVTPTPGEPPPGGHTPGPGVPPRPLARGEAPPLFTCDPSQVPDELPLPRLSRAQLANTLRSAIARALPGQADAVWAAVEPTFAQYPVDQREPAPGDLKGGYSRLDQSIQQSQVDAMYGVGQAVARELTATPARFAVVMGACATDASTANDRACLETFIRSWGARVMRQPLPQSEVAWFADIAGATPVDPGAVADVVVTLLNAPQVLYRVEHGTADAQPVIPLSGHELAARLSYLFWQAPPDDALWDAAASGALLTPAGFAAALERLLESDHLADSVTEFVAEWLRLDELPSLVALQNDPVYRAFAGSPMPTDVSRAAMIDDVQLSARHTLRSGGSASDFLTDRRSYTGDSYLAGVYGVPSWKGTGEAPLLPSPNRAGLLTRAAMLATGTASTRPIHKGYLIRNALLCQSVGAPPPNASTIPPAPTAAMTTRQTVTQLTSGGTCGGCHTTLINPQGFVLEGFDALGRERAVEKLYDAQGTVTASPPIDTTAEVLIHGGETQPLSTPAALTQLIDESRLFHSCLARHYFRFAAARVESARDGCLLSQLEAAARDRPMGDVLRTLANHITFKSRRFQ
jgi:hypothetical protein